ncbi:MAG: type II secretion system protein [Patescibacteria group bacterium]
MKRGFTLVELLVVISIVSMLASIVMVQISLAQAKGRDSLRTQQIRQIDTAMQLYVETYKRAPLADSLTGCDIQSENPTEYEDVSSCFAVSTNGTETQEQNWDTLRTELQEFIRLPEDPCGTCVSGSDGFLIGYTYVAPYAMQYYCYTTGTCIATNESYQVYAPLERQTMPTGSEGSSQNYASPNQPPASYALSTPTGLGAIPWQPPSKLLSWQPSTGAPEGASILYYVRKEGNPQEHLVEGTTSFWARVGDYGWIAPYCWTVRAEDPENGLYSDRSEPSCVSAP